MTLAELIVAERAKLDVLLKAESDQATQGAEIVRLKALLAAVPPPPPPPPPAPASADVLWRWNANTIAPFGIHAKATSRVSLVQAGGRNAVRLLTMPGDNNVNGSGAAERCDLRLGNADSDATEGREWWFSHGVWFPADYVDLPQSNGAWHWGSAFNWHDDADDGRSQGPVQLIIYPPTAVSADRATGLNYQIFGGTSGNNQLGQFPVEAIRRERWYDFKYHIRWTSGPTGFCDGWVGGRQFMAYKGPTLHAGHGAYLKAANYHTAHGKASAILHGTMVRSRTEAGLA